MIGLTATTVLLAYKFHQAIDLQDRIYTDIRIRRADNDQITIHQSIPKHPGQVLPCSMSCEFDVFHNRFPAILNKIFLKVQFAPGLICDLCGYFLV